MELRRTGYKRGWFKTHSLAQQVVSIGNLTVGGTGKTPLAACVAAMLLRSGRKPAILTRGYGRASRAKLIVVPPDPGRHPRAEDVGDEPALLARQLPEIPIVVCADRFQGGKWAEEKFGVDVHILDDGFQHWSLARRVDVLTLDATQPLSDWNLLPAGRQREPLAALRRAQVIVLTRIDSADAKSLEQTVLNIHPAARVFHSRTKLVGLSNLAGGEAVPIERFSGKEIAAFCGLGNPHAFFADLRRWGFRVASETAFPDHHRYTMKALNRLAEAARRDGAAALLTTQKDAVKIPAEWLPQVPVLACAIEIVPAGDFESVLMSFLQKAAG